MFHSSISFVWFLTHYVVLPFLSALYAGVIVSRFNRFYNAKDMACRMIFEIKPVLQKNDVMLQKPRIDEILQFPIQVLRDSGQLDAHYILLNIATEIGKELDQAGNALAGGASEFKLNKDRWEVEARIMQPSMKAVFTVRPYRF
jgi:hypothetical protein